MSGKLLGDSGLADAGLSRKEHHPARAPRGLGQRRLEQLSLLAPPDEIPPDLPERFASQPAQRFFGRGNLIAEQARDDPDQLRRCAAEAGFDVKGGSRRCFSRQQPEEKETQGVKVAAHRFARGPDQGEAGHFGAGLSVEPHRRGRQPSVRHADEVSVSEGRANRLRHNQSLIGRHPSGGLYGPGTREVPPFHGLKNKVGMLAVFPCIVGRRNVRMNPQPRRRPRLDDHGARRIRSADDQQHGALENRVACSIEASRRRRGDLAHVSRDGVSIRSYESTRLELHQAPRSFNNNHKDTCKG